MHVHGDATRLLLVGTLTCSFLDCLFSFIEVVG